ncbi:hypothetical protein JIN84_17775 [Luteolibacter yonseiensis]|uniref:Uncharacterized protein n=1 Tax=Luteolibacter yonseiensis TaxID=1144680 RepID=A0A934R9F4_9BACT|nr:hypothetical protein [Luteolibacter yonseiensis]MBK1817474.1 hypothetical protein [Luteolibacter yonseiensis]
MRTAVIVQDPAGYRLRVQALQAAHPNVHAFSSITHPHPHTRAIHIPADWIPADPSMPYDRRCWLKSEAMGTAAVIEHRIMADQYWFIESDVVASQDRWTALFADWEGVDADCVCQPLRLRANTPEIVWWKDPGTPAWADAHLLMSCYRLSRRAVLEMQRCAVEMRECLSEITVASVMRRAGMSMANVNGRQMHWNSQTMKTHEHKVIINPKLVNHPVKANTFGVPLTTAE